MDFIVVRLGKDSIPDVKKIDATKPGTFEPFTLEFTCKQVEQSIQPGAYAFIYLGSDNNNGTPTTWKQGLRAIGILQKKSGGENFQADCTLQIQVFSVFNESLDQYSFLETCALLYKHFSSYPVIGVRSSRNNAVQKVNEGPRAKSSALLTALNLLNPSLENDLNNFAPDLLPLLGFQAASEVAFGEGETKNAGGTGSAKVATNTIFYGAPGTGKSFAIYKTINPVNAVVTVFHPESSNSDFIGSVKPVMAEDKDGIKKLSYEFLPGPFLKSLVTAINNPQEHYWLVIEELNRAPAAAVFGEIFQLLDRNSEGKSTYMIDFPDRLSQEFVNSQVMEPLQHLYLPSNLSLLASMNSSDQGVLPLDTAFKRRWKFVYIPLDFEKGCTEGSLDIVLDDGVIRTITWQSFAVCINTVLSDASIPEDRHLGPYFLSIEDLKDTEFVLTGKLFMYLWDDVLRHGLRHRLFDSTIKTYGSLVNRWNSKQKVFNDEFLQLMGEAPSLTEIPAE